MKSKSLFAKELKLVYLLLFFLLINPFQSFSNDQNIGSQVKEKPIEVSVTLRINKIYQINSVDETYKIDGYILYSWKDGRYSFDPNDSLSDPMIYENERAKDLMKTKLFIPAFELINIQGSREVSNLSITMHSDGLLHYEERFFATFNAPMNFRPFPFDKQKYEVKIEAFSYDKKKLIFKQSELLPKFIKTKEIGEDWNIISQKDTITSEPYTYFEDTVQEANSYSRITFSIEAERLPNYYFWQVLFPLLIIILASFAIFWIDEIGTQIDVGFTLMLTVVAFNFYSASILPKLSYNTFIEYVIIVGYIFILLGIIAIIINQRINGVDNKKDKVALMKYFRFIFPSAFIVIMISLYFMFVVEQL